MNTAMDDGRQESPGEQTLSFRPVRDDDASDGAEAVRGGGGPEEARETRDRPPSTDDPPTDADDTSPTGSRGPAAGRPGTPEEPTGERPSLFTARTPARKPDTAERDAAGPPGAAAPDSPGTTLFGTPRPGPSDPPGATTSGSSGGSLFDASGGAGERGGSDRPGAAAGRAVSGRAAAQGKPVKPVTPGEPTQAGKPADGGKPAAVGDPVATEKPSLFVRPASLGGPESQNRQPAPEPAPRYETTEPSDPETAASPPEQATASLFSAASSERRPGATEESGLAPQADRRDDEPEPRAAEQPSDAESFDAEPFDAESFEEQSSGGSSAAGKPQDEEPSRDQEGHDPEARDQERQDPGHPAPAAASAAADLKRKGRKPGDEARQEPEPAGDDGKGPATPDGDREAQDAATGGAREAQDDPAGDAREAQTDPTGDAREGRGAADSGEKGRDSAAREQAGGSEEELPAEAAETLMAALDALRESIAALRFGLDLPGAEEARQAQADLLAQLEGYVLPRVRTSAAPALIVIAGSTGAGKSTLVNSLAERNISRTGVRRPTTGTPVLACHPDDRRWFAEGELLGGLTRVDQPSPDAGLRSLVIVSTEKLPQGVALLDTPDIDSVVEEHHEVAHRMLDAADLWIFVTTAARYADAPAWNLLRLAKERGARLAIVLSRVQPKSADVVLKHFGRMLTEYGLGEIDRFVIHEAKVHDGRLPDSEVVDLRLWLAELSVDEERRAQAVRETLNGVLDSFRTRVPALAKHLEGQVAFRAELRGDVEAAFLGALSEIDKASKNGSLLHGEVLARWQDFAGSGDLMRSLQLRKRNWSKRAPERVTAFRTAIRAGLESVIVAAANRAAEEVVARWRHRAELGASLGEGLERPSDNLVRHTGRAIATWQDHLSELVRTEGVAKRSVSKLVSFDPDSLSLIFTVAMFSGSNGEGVPHRLVNALLGAESLRGIGAKALSDLRARIGMLFDEESMRYVQALDSAGIPDESVATRLYQATYNLEVAR
ncbi:dynamin family protein [Nonomuraea jiangxiensis]|uniref:Dynamin family protein n=1 Tax=Nonomuraea jiangxiensis TaxID=633440 RepID=A0A1G9FWD9_9ACTN|nr:dynamin family protein [Nonomuraea jiangxiensis]SDK92473.1 Dynamin family protein [Nonomuraea jiangxiensis]